MTLAFVEIGGYCFRIYGQKRGREVMYGVSLRNITAVGLSIFANFAHADGQKTFISTTGNPSDKIMSSGVGQVFEESLSSPNGKFHLVMGSDGRLGFYEGPNPMERQRHIWLSNSAPGPGKYFMILKATGDTEVLQQRDGQENLSISGFSGSPVGDGVYSLNVEDSGDVLIRRNSPTGERVWSLVEGLFPDLWCIHYKMESHGYWLYSENYAEANVTAGACGGVSRGPRGVEALEISVKYSDGTKKSNVCRSASICTLEERNYVTSGRTRTITCASAGASLREARVSAGDVAYTH